MRRALFAVAVFAGSIGCNGPTDGLGLPAGAVTVAVGQVVPPTSWSGFLSRDRIIVRDQQQWEVVWSAYAHIYLPVPPVPPVDFSSSMVIVAAMGERSNGGYGIEIEGVYATDTNLYAVVNERSPGGGNGCAQHNAVNHPVHMVVVPRRDRVVNFVERTSVSRC